MEKNPAEILKASLIADNDILVLESYKSFDYNRWSFCHDDVPLKDLCEFCRSKNILIHRCPCK